MIDLTAVPQTSYRRWDMSLGQASADELEDLVGRTLDGRYRLDQFIDRGGFGAVYRGLDLKFEKPIAVKVGASLRELKKEAVLAGQVQHDHVVQVTDYGHDHGLAYLVMEFLNGENLDAILKSYQHKLPTFLLRKFVQEVGDALAHAHAENLIHRDLKPRNIILRRPTSKAASGKAIGKFVLLDFGIAAKLDSTGTMANRTMTGAGTVEYMPPELLGKVPEATPLSDIFSFGVVLYQLLTGRVPFPQAANSHLALAQCMIAIHETPPPQFREVAPGQSYPPAIEELVRQCLEKDPSKRPQSMTEVCERFLANFPDDTATPFSETLRPGQTAAVLESLATPGPSVDWSQRAPGASQRIWPYFAAGFLVVAIGIVWLRVFRPNAPVSNPQASFSIEAGTGDEVHWDKLETGRLELTAGQARRLYWAISGLSADDHPKFEVASAPAGLDAELSSGADENSSTVLLRFADLNSSPDAEQTLMLRASVPARPQPLEWPLTVVIRRPSPWLPESIAAQGFQPAPGARLHQIEGQIFASILERTNDAETVRLFLVPGLPEAVKGISRPVSPFYVMESPVSNALFAKFADARPQFQDAARAPGERGWDVRDAGPVTDITVIEAQRFADWFAPGIGNLPSRLEWDAASGYYDFVAVVRESLGKGGDSIDSIALKELSKKDVSILGNPVSLAKSPSQCEFNGEQGRSPYGCRYATLADGSRLYEMTGTVTTRRVTDEFDIRELLNSGSEKRQQLQDAHIWCRGPKFPTEDFSFVKDIAGGQQLKSIDDFDDDGFQLPLPAENPDDQLESPRRSNIGFRVVLRTAGAAP